MSEQDITQQKQWRDLSERERTLWGGIEPSPMRLTAARPRQAQINIEYDEQLDDESLYPTRPPSSTRRYHTNDVPTRELIHPGRQDVRQRDRYNNVNVYIRRKRPQQQAAPRQHHPQSPQTSIRQPGESVQSDDEAEIGTQRFSHNRQRTQQVHVNWPLVLGIGMILIVLLWIGGSLVVNWWQGYQENVQYGHPRTYQTDAIVGHNDIHIPSHFIALNLNRQVEVIEFPGGDATKAKVYIGPTLLGQDSNLDIVTISFKDVNGDGKPDMILSVANAKYVYINDNRTFRPLHADEHITL